MHSFNSLGELESFVMNNAKAGLQTVVANKVKKILRDYVEENVYSSYTPRLYQRTNELIDSISIRLLGASSKGVMVEIYFSPDKMNHTSLLGGSGVNAGDNVYIPRWVDEGET